LRKRRRHIGRDNLGPEAALRHPKTADLSSAIGMTSGGPLERLHFGDNFARGAATYLCRVKTVLDSQATDVSADRHSEVLFTAYHNAGHTVGARAIEGGSAGLEDWLNFAAAGHAAERELAARSGLRWRRIVSNAGNDVESCHHLIRLATGEDHREWILLHWTRAVTRATRLLTSNWGEVVRLAELHVRRAAHRATKQCLVRGLPLERPSRTEFWSGWWDQAIRRHRRSEGA
jgi:hypothetical protein